jgi:AcrR family transcriptional regulator
MARPRSARAHEQVLKAAAQLFAERGIDNTSMDAISDASGVSKATVYKHWADKDALSLDVLARLSGDLPLFHSSDIRADIVALLKYQPPMEQSQIKDRLMPHFMARAARDPEFGAAWRARMMQPPRTRLRQLLKRAVSEGQLLADLDLDLATALLLGPMMYRHVLMLSKTKLPEDMPQRVVDAFWRAHAVPTKNVLPKRNVRLPVLD